MQQSDNRASRRLLWVGAAFRDALLYENRALNQAAHRWTRGLLDGLCQAGVEISALSHYNERHWPRGALYPNRPDAFADNVTGHLVPHVNMPLIRTRSLVQSYRRNMRRLLQRECHFEAVVTYNALPWTCAAAELAQAEFDIPWVCINLDFDEPGEQWEHYRAIAGHASGHVFLSWWAFENCPLQPRMHLDGGCEASLPPVSQALTAGTKKRIVYTGKQTWYGGVDLLVDFIQQTTRADVEFILCGKDRHPKIVSLAAEDTRVVLKGFVDEEAMNELCAGADVLVNPCNTSFIGSRMNFPSKLLYYLSFGVPVLSPWTAGVAPDYESLLIQPKAETGAAMAQALDGILEWGAQARSEYAHQCFSYLESNKQWRVQAARLIEFIEKEVHA